ncbi:MAG: serine/threonine protein kinase [Bryobacterales bacterium]|nr:serine/threonine protein kinase [Bryobacterales bacterium]
MDRIGRYRIVKELGRGAMGVVYQAIDPTIGRPLAIKTIRLRELDDPGQRARLRERLFREARSAGVLSHPGIVTIYDMEEEDGLAYIAMQFVNGPTLDELMAGKKPMQREQIFRVFHQTAAALDFAHQKGIVHRDIKPANIMIDEDGTVKIADFGIAKAGASGNLTLSGTILGTPNYMSPEQVQGTNIDGRSDQFSLAVVAYEILTGERPFAGEHLGTVVYKIVAEQPAEPHRLNPSLGAEITSVLRKALSKQPDQRFASCTEFVNALADACSRAEGWRGLVRGGGHSLPTAAGVAGPRRAQSTPVIAANQPTAAGARNKNARRTKPKSLFLPAVGAFLVVLGVLGLLAWQTGAFSGAMAGPKPKNTATANATPPKVETSAAPDDTEIPPPAPTVPSPAPGADAPVKQNVKAAIPAATSRPQSRASAPAPSSVPKRSPFGGPPPGKEADATAAPAWGNASMPQDVWVVTNPPGATAALDGRSDGACQTPCMLLGQRGIHSLSLSLANFQSERRQIRVEGERLDVPPVTLRPAGGTLMLSTIPSGANIFINDKLLTELTPAQLSLAPGSYRVSVERNGSRTTQQVEIRNGATNYIRIPLKP